MATLSDIVQRVVLDVRDAVEGARHVAESVRRMGRDMTAASAEMAAGSKVAGRELNDLGDDAETAERKVKGLNRAMAETGPAGAQGAALNGVNTEIRKLGTESRTTEGHVTKLSAAQKDAERASLSAGRADLNHADAKQRLNKVFQDASSTEHDFARALFDLRSAEFSASEAHEKHALSLKNLDKDLSTVGKDLTNLGGGGGGKSPLTDIASGFGEMSKGVGGLGAAFALLKIPAIISGISELLNVVSALAGGLVAMAGAMAPAVGAFAALPGILFTAALAAGAVKVAISGVSEAIQGYAKAQLAAKDPKWAQQQLTVTQNLNKAQQDLTLAYSKENVAGMISAKQGLMSAQREQTSLTREQTAAQRAYQMAMDKMDPSVNVFVHLLDQLKPKFEEIKKAAQGGLFPGITTALSTINTSGLLTTIKQIFKPITAAVGQFAADLATMLASPRWQGALRTFGADAVTAIHRLGGALINLLDGMRAIGLAARPLTNWFGQLGAQALTFFKATATAGQESGRLTSFLVKTRDVLTTMGRTISNVSRGLYQIFSSGANLGRDMGSSFEDLTNKFRKWTRSAEGQQKINGYFEAIRPVLHELAMLFGDVFRGLGKMMTDANNGTAGLIGKLRTGLLPEIFKVFGGLNSTFGPAFTNLIIAVAKVFGDLAGTTGPLLILVRVLTSIFETVDKIIKSSPGMKNFVVVFTGLAVAFKVFKVDHVITGISQVATGLTKMISPARAAALELKKVEGAPSAFGNLVKILKAVPSEVLFGAAALVLLGVALVKLYKTNEVFRTAVQGAWKAIWAVIGPIVTGLIRFLGDLATFVSDNIGVIGALAAVYLATLLPALLTTSAALIQQIALFVVLNGLKVASALSASLLATGVAAGVAAIAIYGLVTAYGDAKRAAAAARAEIDKKYDPKTYDGLLKNIQATQGEIDRLTPKVKSHRNAWGILTGGLQLFASVLPGVDATMFNDQKALEAHNKALEGNQVVATNAKNTYEALGTTFGITADQARDLFPQLNLPIDASAHDAFTAFRQLFQGIRDGKPTVTALGNAFDELAKAQGDAVDTARAYGDMLDALIDPFFNTQKATDDLNVALGKGTDAVDAYGKATGKINSEWADAQKAAATDVADANKTLASAKANLAAAYSKEDVAGLQAAKDDVARAQADVDQAKAAQTKAAKKPTADTTGQDPHEAAKDLLDKYKAQLSAWARDVANKVMTQEDFEKKVADLRPQMLAKLKTLKLSQTDLDAITTILDNVDASLKLAPILLAPGVDKARKLYTDTQGMLDDFLAHNPGAALALKTKLVLPDTTPLTGPGITAAAAGPAAAPVPFDGVKAHYPAWYASLTPAQQAGVETPDNYARKTRGLAQGSVIRAEEGRPPMTSDTPILWAEGRDTEAYIPYDRQYRGRAIGLLAQVASDFGLAVVPRAAPVRPQVFADGGIIPRYAIGAITDGVHRAAMGTITATSAAYSASRRGSSAGGTSSSHLYDIHVETVDRPTGEQLGRDIAWGVTQARGQATSRVGG